jgi:hypothetical protein
LFDKENKQKGVSEYYYYLVNNYRKVVTMEPQREGKRGTGRVSAREWRGEVSLYAGACWRMCNNAPAQGIAQKTSQRVTKA